MENWDLAKWLEVLAYLVAVFGGVFGAIRYLLRVRANTIESIRSTIARAWTNEGDIHSTDSVLVTLDLVNHDGDIIGSLSSSNYEKVLEAHAEIGWLRTTLHISELLGRSLVPMGTVHLRLAGNKNRLIWRLKGKSVGDAIPSKTVLWPSSVGVTL